MKWVISGDDLKTKGVTAGGATTQGALLLMNSSLIGTVITAAPKSISGSKTGPVKTGNPQIDEYFTVYQNQAALKAEINNPNKYHIWANYFVGSNYCKPRLQRDYMLFCGGWLQFWDLNVSTEADERSLYFEWNTNVNSVTVYLSNETPRKGYRVSLLIVPPPGNSTDPPKVPPPPPPSA